MHTPHSPYSVSPFWRTHKPCNVPYYFKDAASLLLWMQAVGVPPHFDIEEDWRSVDYLLTEYMTPRGVETNEHRELLIVRASV